MVTMMRGNPYEEEQDPRTALLQNLQRMQQMQQMPQDPSTSQNAFLNLLSQAGGRLGTLNGVAPVQDTNPLEKYSQVLAQAAEARKAGMMNGLGLKHKTLEYLTSQRDKKAMAEAERAEKASALSEKRALEEGLQKNRFSHEKELEGLRGNNARQLEGLRGANQKEIAAERVKTAPVKMSPGQMVAEKEGAKDVVDFRKNAQKSLEDIRALKEASDALSKNETISGPLRGLAPDKVRNYTNEEAMKVKRKIKSVGLSTIKTLLTGVTSDRDVALVLDNIWNDQASTATNKETVDKMIRTLEGAYKTRLAQAQWFDEHGTLQGFNVPVPSLDDLKVEEQLFERNGAMYRKVPGGYEKVSR